MPSIDEDKLLYDYFDYAITAQGVEPKLKLPIKPLPRAQEKWNFEQVLEYIIIGPTVSALLSQTSFSRMLEKMNKENFRKKIKMSGIPLRNNPRRGEP